MNQDLYCMAQHLQSFVEDAKHERVADFGKPCATCKFHEKCDFDFYKKSDVLTKLTGIRISALIRDKKVNYKVNGASL